MQKINKQFENDPCVVMFAADLDFFDFPTKIPGLNALTLLHIFHPLLPIRACPRRQPPTVDLPLQNMNIYNEESTPSTHLLLCEHCLS